MFSVSVDLFWFEENSVRWAIARAVAASREYFRNNPDGGLLLQEVAVECGLPIDQIGRTD
jgi:hypothetical protein